MVPGKTFWGLGASGNWGLQTGTMETKTLSPDSAAVAAGYYNDTTLDAVDGDLTAGNIRKDVIIFGVTGRLVDASNATRVPKTGQTGCWNQSGTSIGCSDTGQDGEYQLGVLPEVSPSSGIYGSYTVYGWSGIRFTDNHDGTVTDNLTGLIWLKNARCFVGWRSWIDALNACNTLADGLCGLTDGSSAGDWRLPNVNELHSLVDPTMSDPALPAGYPFTNVSTNYYRCWSSTTFEAASDDAWYVYLLNGSVGSADKDAGVNVWPVRSGN